jgi:chromatin segregation and condensation protein Rec8/ScpA/Scc1 (kleisin family)
VAPALLDLTSPPPSLLVRYFSELLLLKSRGLVEMQQAAPYGEVDVCLTQPGLEASEPQLIELMQSQRD